MAAVRTRTIEKDERCRKDIKLVIKWGLALGHETATRGKGTDEYDVELRTGGTRIRDLIRFNLYINSAGTGKNVQNYDM